MNRKIETLYTFTEILPWVEEYVNDRYTRMEQEKRAREIKIRQHKRAVLRRKIENILKGIALIAMPFLLANFSGVDEVLISLFLTIPGALGYFTGII